MVILYNRQKKKGQNDKNNIQKNTTQKYNDWAARTSLKFRGELRMLCDTKFQWLSWSYHGRRRDLVLTVTKCLWQKITTTVFRLPKSQSHPFVIVHDLSPNLSSFMTYHPFVIVHDLSPFCHRSWLITLLSSFMTYHPFVIVHDLSPDLQ